MLKVYISLYSYGPLEELNNSLYGRNRIFISCNTKKKADDPKDPINERVLVIIQSIENKCDLYKNCRKEDVLFIKFLLEQFAIKFVKWHYLDENHPDRYMWLEYKRNIDKRWSILRPFWLNHVKQTIYSHKVKREMFKVKIIMFKEKIKELFVDLKKSILLLKNTRISAVRIFTVILIFYVFELGVPYLRAQGII